MLIPSKLSRPVRLESTVTRDRLLQKLGAAGNYRLVLVTSPAGYGKTTLVSQWAADKKRSGLVFIRRGRQSAGTLRRLSYRGAAAGDAGRLQPQRDAGAEAAVRQSQRAFRAAVY
ncbi:hypothetical protein OJE16_18680 [Pantoea tagorei]